MSPPLAMPSGAVPLPDPQYLRRSIDPQNADSYRAFERAYRAGDLASVANLIYGPNHSSEFFTQGLFAATYQNKSHIVHLLLNKGAVVDRSVSLAAEQRPNATRILDDEALVKWFLDHGAQLNSRPQSSDVSAGGASATTSDTYLNVAGSKSNVTTFDMLLDHGATKANSIPLHPAAGGDTDNERIPMMAHLIDIGYDINATDGIRGHQSIGTPLHYAVRAKSLAKAIFLLQKGADPHKSVGLAGYPLEMAERMELDHIDELLK